MHVIPIAGCDPTSLCRFCLVFVLVVCFSVVCFVFLVFLLGLHTGLRIGPLPVLLWLSTNWQPCTIITIHLLLRSNVCNDLAEAMKALDGKKEFPVGKQAPSTRPQLQKVYEASKEHATRSKGIHESLKYRAQPQEPLLSPPQLTSELPTLLVHLAWPVAPGQKSPGRLFFADECSVQVTRTPPYKPSIRNALRTVKGVLADLSCGSSSFPWLSWCRTRLENHIIPPLVHATKRLLVQRVHWTGSPVTFLAVFFWCKPHGQHSHRFMDTIQKPAMTLSCRIWKVEIEKWNVVWKRI